MWKVLFVIGLTSLVSAQDRDRQTEDGQRKTSGDLRSTVFKRYDSKFLPVKNPLKRVSVEVALEPLFIHKMDENSQMLTLDAYLHLKWKDEHLKWSSESHQGVKKLVVPSIDIWTPDITTRVMPIERKLTQQTVTNAILSNSGHVSWTQLLNFNSHCPMNQSDSSDDIHVCEILLHSQSYDSSSLNLTITSSNELQNFEDKNVGWSLLSMTSQTVNVNFSCCTEVHYSGIQYEITVKQKEIKTAFITDKIAYYAIFLSLLMFWLPPDSTHKVLLGAFSELLLCMGNFYLDITLRSSAARHKATERMFPLMCLVASGLCMEILIINMARMLVHCRPSRCLLGIAKCCCQPFCVCISRPYANRDFRMSVQSDKMKKYTPTAQEEWNIIAMACDRVLFLIALLVCVFFYKFW